MSREDRNPHARTDDAEVGQAENLAALVAELLFFVGLLGPVLDEGARQRQDVEGHRCRELRGFGERHRAAVEGELAGAVGHPADLLVELGDTHQTRSRDRLVGRGDDAS